MNKINLLNIIEKLLNFLNSIESKTDDEKLEMIIQIKRDYLLLKKSLTSFTPEVTDSSIINEKSPDRFYIKKFYLDLFRTINKLIARFENKYDNWIEEFLQ